MAFEQRQYSRYNCQSDIYCPASGQIHLNTPLSACDGGTVLHCAAKSGLVPAVHMLRVAGAEVDGLDKEQNTPLTVAILSSKNDVVKYLIKAGANLTLKVRF